MEQAISAQITFLKNSIKKPVVLVGLMGAGKTSVGKALAERLAVRFKDADDLIVSTAGKAIDDIFKGDGEFEFRKLEITAIEQLLSNGLSVLSTGGGAFVQNDTHALIQERGISVYLRADLGVLMERIQKDKIDGAVVRPLLAKSNPAGVLKEIMAMRAETYEKAHVIVDTDQLSIEQASQQVIQGLCKHLNAV